MGTRAAKNTRVTSEATVTVFMVFSLSRRIGVRPVKDDHGRKSRAYIRLGQSAETDRRVAKLTDCRAEIILNFKRCRGRRLGQRRSSYRECGGEELLFVVKPFKCDKLLNEGSYCWSGEIYREPKGATAGGNLEDTIGVVGRFVLAIGLVVMICRVVLIGWLRLIKKVMYPMRGGVEEKKQ